MQLDTVPKRVGILLIIASLIIFLIMVLAWVFSTPQLIAYHTPQGQIIYYKRGYMETLLVEWLEITLIALPMFLCGVALFIGYGSRLWRWILHGSQQEESGDKS